MKRDRSVLGGNLNSRSSSPPQESTSSLNMSKRSRVGGRYSSSNQPSNTINNQNSNNNEDSNSDQDSPLHDNGGGGGVNRRHHHSASRSGGRRDGGASPGGGSSSGRRYDHGSGGGGGGGGDYSRRSTSYKDHRGGGPNVPGPSTTTTTYPYKVLCMSKLHPKASDDFIRDALYREFKRYGDISVKVVNEPDERVAYVYFRSAEDAREVKHSKVGIYIYERMVKVEAAYESAPSGGGGSSAVQAPYNNTKPHHHEYDKYASNNRSSAYSSSYAYRNTPPTNYDSRRDDRGGGGYDRYDRMPPQQPMHYNTRDYNRDYAGGGRQQNQQQPYGRYQNPPSSGPHHPPPHHMSHQHNNQHHSGPPGGLLPPRHHPGPNLAPMHLDHQMGPPSGHHHNLPPPGVGGPSSGPIGGPPGSRDVNFDKKDKFPNYLHHINPEDDKLATRTLFAGNLEVNITDEELRRIFGRYGIVEDIDIKRPPPGTGNAYAFVRFVNLDMSSRAKCELSGQYIGKFQCKIGYGKMNPTTKIWVGGLGPWTTLQMLEREFDRFGSIKKIEWAKGEIVAYITYETIDAAQAAVKDMRGYPLGGPDKRLRTDFADAGAPLVGAPGAPGQNFGYDSQQQGQGDFEYNNKFGNGNKDDKTASPHSSNDLLASPGVVSDDESTNGSLSSARTIQEIAARAPVAWTGGLILKISSFPTRFYLTDGDMDGIEMLMKDEDGKCQLKITQRLKLDQGKLDDVLKRITAAPAHGIFLSLPSTAPNSSNVSSPNNNEDGSAVQVQYRPLRNLVSYLKQKEAAGVISLGNPSHPTGVLYVFPPCPFSWNLLKRGVTGLVVEDKEVGGKDVADHLVVVVIKGGVRGE